ncbi:hypothetical protein PanWU01x14_073890 [Parasponia andersonii]|uniref:Uncharacterized protein n=1 Tax=Parasponia andersonii TaxID=3476 RepID=A0A2P5DD81_PARAD|nr:hypothetical protein PanWU01x14_073890 [Parasponia andersonii]
MYKRGRYITNLLPFHFLVLSYFFSPSRNVSKLAASQHLSQIRTEENATTKSCAPLPWKITIYHKKQLSYDYVSYSPGIVIINSISISAARSSLPPSKLNKALPNQDLDSFSWLHKPNM